MVAELGRLWRWGRGARAPVLPQMAMKEPGARAGSAHRDTPGCPTHVPVSMGLGGPSWKHRLCLAQRCPRHPARCSGHRPAAAPPEHCQGERLPSETPKPLLL